MRTPRVYPTLLRAYWERALVYRAVFVVSVISAMFPLALMAIWPSGTTLSPAVDPCLETGRMSIPAKTNRLLMAIGLDLGLTPSSRSSSRSDCACGCPLAGS
jgi:hypothetical protein